MDYLDQQILMKLKENARQSASDISKEIHLSVSTVIDRIRKMESSGVIESYTVITDEKKTGNDVTALMEISLEHPRYNELFIENIKKNPNIISCDIRRCDRGSDYILCICKNKKTKFLADGRHRMCRAGFGTDHRSLGQLFQQRGFRRLYKWSVCDATATECRTQFRCHAGDDGAPADDRRRTVYSGAPDFFIRKPLEYWRSAAAVAFYEA